MTFHAGDVAVPLYGDTGALVNLQLINVDGLKRTLKGGAVKGTCHTLEGKKEAGKRLWIAEGYATALTVHHMTGETVMVALSSVNLLSLASLARQTHPACQIVLAADRDLSGNGQTKAAAAAQACEGTVALPPVFGDWNDAFMQQGEDATRKAIYAAIRPPAQSPFDTMSEAEFTAMSTSEKAMRVHEHYGEALAVDANGQPCPVMKPGHGKSSRHRTLHAMWPGCSSACVPVLVRENCLGGRHPETNYPPSRPPRHVV